MSEKEFVGRMIKASKLQGEEIRHWENTFKQFLNIRNTMVKQMLGDNEEVSLSSVYADLTVVKQKPRPVELEDKTTYNEITYLRKIAKKRTKNNFGRLHRGFGIIQTDKPEI